MKDPAPKIKGTGFPIKEQDRARSLKLRAPPLKLETQTSNEAPGA